MRAGDRRLLYGLVAGEAGRAVASGARRLLRMSWRVPRPERLLFAPQDLRTADPTVAADIAGGLFAFAGHDVETGGASPFAVEPPAAEWERALYGFGWLRHLRAADTPEARSVARALVTDAVSRHRRELGRARGAEAAVAARRLISFLCQSPLVLNGADRAFYGSFLGAVGLTVAVLERDGLSARRPADRLAAAVALSYAALCCSGLEHRLRRATRHLSTELDAQILPDGGHISRDPRLLTATLLDLLPLRLLYRSRNLAIPDALARAIDRIMPMLRFLRSGPREVGLFNGMGRTAIDQMATLLSYEDGRATVLGAASQSGYLRMEAGDTVLLADIGPAPPFDVSESACAGCLSFELSARGSRLVVNAGTPSGDGRRRHDARGTAAHSTLQIGDGSSASFLDDYDGVAAGWLRERHGNAVLTGPDQVVAERTALDDDGALCTARHDGWVARFGVMHERRWRLAGNGARLDGEDRLEPARGGAAAAPDAVARFHLHPAVTPTAEGDTIRLDHADGERWRFVSSTARPVLEPSTYFGGAEGWRPTRQIVLPLRALDPGRPPAAFWSFARDGDTPNAAAPIPSDPS